MTPGAMKNALAKLARAPAYELDTVEDVLEWAQLNCECPAPFDLREVHVHKAPIPVISGALNPTPRCLLVNALKEVANPVILCQDNLAPAADALYFVKWNPSGVEIGRWYTAAASQAGPYRLIVGRIDNNKVMAISAGGFL